MTLLALSLLCVLVASPARATCPPTAGYGATTRPTLAARPLDDIGFWDDEACTAINPENQCVYGVVTPSNVDAKDSLFVFLPGLGGYPRNHVHIANMAGYAGYRAIFPLWDNELSVGQVCAGTSGLVGGTCPTDDDDDCQRIVRNELITGRDDLASDAYSPPNRLASISHRLALALDREAELDTSNTWNWTQYCEPDPDHGTAIHWADVVVAGHSFGGNQAAYIAYRTPTRGAFVIDSGYDTCESEFPASTYDIYDDDFSGYNTTGEAALWYSTFTRATTDWVFALHEQDIFPSVVRPELPPSMEFYVPNAVDDTTGWPEDGAWFDNDADADTGDTGFQQGTWAGERFIATSQAAAVQGDPIDPECTAQLQPHASMASDNCMPNAVGEYAYPTSATDGSSTLRLFDTFVSAFCALGD